MLGNKDFTNLTALCKVFNSENRVELFLKIVDEKNPIIIAKDLNLSRAGLQKHLEVLLETGLLIKNGRGRNTKYSPSMIATLIFQHLKQLGLLLETQREIIRIESTLSTINETETRISLKEEFEIQTKKLNNLTKDLQFWMKQFK